MPGGDVMRIVIPILLVVTHVVGPLLLVGWLAFTRVRTRVQLAAIGALALSGTLVLVLTQVGWNGPSGFARAFWALALVAALLRAAYRWRELRWLPDSRRAGPRLAIALLCALGLGASYLAVRTTAAVATARTHVGEPVDLVFPLRGPRTFFVYFGGGNAVVNPNHQGTPGGRYALDIGALNALGMNADGLFPADVRAYAVYGARVVTPCSGTVTSTLDGLPELKPGHMDFGHMFGNHVLLHCVADGVSVMLGHFREGTIAVEPGRAVRAGEDLGRVGNSGSTMLPHLHIHAVRGRAQAASELGDHEPVPMRFDGHLLVQFDTVESP